MKKLIALFAFIYIQVVPVVHANAQEKNKDVMVKRIFSVLKNKDEAGFVKLFPDAATTKIIFAELFKMDSTNGGNPDSATGKMESIESYLNEISDSSLQKEYREDFRRVIERGTVLGINWAGSELESYTMDSVLISDGGLTAPKLSGKIYFKSAGRDYFILYDAVIFVSNRGWYGVTIKRTGEKGKETEAEETYPFYIPVEDTAVMADAPRATIIEEKPANTTPKTPGKTQPAKTKSQSPAKKPD